MTQDEIIKMARQAGGTPYVNRHYPGETSFAFGPKAFESFVQLLVDKATDETNARANASWTLMCKKMVEAEREACAKLFDDRDNGIGFFEPHEPAEIIRARGQE